jgi:SAM-dependent methyltransferase
VKIRLRIARFQMRLGRFIESLALMLLTPDDLLELNRLRYSRREAIDFWSDQETVAWGLYPEEQDLLAKVPRKSGRALVVGVGGGREAIPLAKAGFAVTGLDLLPDIVARAQENARHQGVSLEELVQDVSRLALPANSFDLAVVSINLYSLIPTRRRRRQLLTRINRSLKPGGYVLCCYNYNSNLRIMPRYEFIKRLVATVTGGYRDYEPGDRLHFSEFVHFFYPKTSFAPKLRRLALKCSTASSPVEQAGAGRCCAKRPSAPTT